MQLSSKRQKLQIHNNNKNYILDAVTHLRHQWWRHWVWKPPQTCFGQDGGMRWKKKDWWGRWEARPSRPSCMQAEAEADCQSMWTHAVGWLVGWLSRKTALRSTEPNSWGRHNQIFEWASARYEESWWIWNEALPESWKLWKTEKKMWSSLSCSLKPHLLLTIQTIFNVFHGTGQRYSASCTMMMKWSPQLTAPAQVLSVWLPVFPSGWDGISFRHQSGNFLPQNYCPLE